MPALVLTYHSISNGPPPLCLPPERLARDLDDLAAAGYRAVPLRTIVERLAAAGEPSAGPRAGGDRIYALTFDDAYRDFRDAALPILRARGAPATVFALAEPGATLPGGDLPLLRIDELAAIAGEAIEIGAHSTRHDDLRGLGPEALDDDLRRCAETLAPAAGRAVEHFAYPFGLYDRRVRDAVGRYFRGACTTRLGLAGDHRGPLELPRVDAVYLGSPALRRAVLRGRPRFALALRRWARRARGLP